MSMNKIAKYAGMASREAHEEYMNFDQYGMFANGHMKDLLTEMIDKFDEIEYMATTRWYNKWYFQMKRKR